MTRVLVVGLSIALMAVGGAGHGYADAASVADLLEKHGLIDSLVGTAFYCFSTRQWFLLFNPDQYFIPASNQKLLTTWAALNILGAGFRFVTQIYGSILEGDTAETIWIRGSGDPTLFPSDPAEALAQAGLKRVLGDVMLDFSMFDLDLWGPGWAWDDANPFIAAISFHQLGLESLSPYDRPGFIAAVARLVEEGFSAAGIRVGREVRAGEVPPGAQLLAEVRSPPLELILKAMNGRSDNFIAEQLFKAIGARYAGRGTFPTGATAMRESVAGVVDGKVIVADGSGLSRYNMVTPRQLVDLLAAAWEAFPAFIDSLPEWGTGTLSQRAYDLPVRAKTGTLRHISALSGYILETEKGPVAFSVLMEGPFSTPRARDFQDDLLRRVVTGGVSW